MGETLAGIDTEFDVIADELAQLDLGFRATSRKLDACIARHKALRAFERGPAAIAVAGAARILHEEAAKHRRGIGLDDTGLALLEARRRIEAELGIPPLPVTGHAQPGQAPVGRGGGDASPGRPYENPGRGTASPLPELGTLIEQARDHVMTPAERSEQARSWVRGEMEMERVAPPTDGEIIDEMLDRVRSKDDSNG